MPMPSVRSDDMDSPSEITTTSRLLSLLLLRSPWVLAFSVLLTVRLNGAAPVSLLAVFAPLIGPSPAPS